jgi:OOP family OmpA-OmpF porin
MIPQGFRCLFFFTVLLPLAGPAQNLVPNGSFEEYRSCPGGYSQHPIEFRADSWRSLTWGTPDLFNTCSGGDAAVPYNWAGISDPYDGYGYAGLYLWLAIKDFREYIHCKLTEPLLKDSLYHVQFRYKLSSYSKYSVDRIGVLVSDSLATLHHDKPLNFTPTIEFVKDSALTPETGSWELATAQFRAKGGEQFLTIGNFSDNQRTHYYHIQFRPAQEPMLAEAAYYYIDDVRLVPQFSQPETTVPLPAFTGTEAELNTTYVLNNIQFAFNSYMLLPESYYDLDRVVAYLLKNPDISVELAGHTDDIGDESYNLTLSTRRAKSAAAYLTSRGISADRIVTTGYGESRFLVDLRTDNARDINRRVEITFRR